MENTKHTPTPWFWEEGSPAITHHWNSKEIAIAEVIKPEWHENKRMASIEAGANAAFIVKAVNAYDDMLEALEAWGNLEQCLDALRGKKHCYKDICGAFQLTKAAIEKAS